MKYKGIIEFHVTMHNVQIQACKDQAWYNLPYMAIEVEIDQLVTTWPPT